MKMAFSTTNHTTRNVIQISITHTSWLFINNNIQAHHVIALSHRYELGRGGIFIFLISIPPYAIIIIYNLLTNRKSKYGIIQNENMIMLKIVIFYMDGMAFKKNLPQNAIYVIQYNHIQGLGADFQSVIFYKATFALASRCE